MSDYQKALETFEQTVNENGITIQHSGCSKKVIYTLTEWLEWDENEAEESFSNHLDSLSLDLVIDLETALGVRDWEQWKLETFGSKYREFVITFNEFGHDAVSGNEGNEVVRVLEGVIKRINDYGLHNCDGLRLKDLNGNNIGDIYVCVND